MRQRREKGDKKGAQKLKEARTSQSTNCHFRKSLRHWYHRLLGGMIKRTKASNSFVTADHFALKALCENSLRIN